MVSNNKGKYKLHLEGQRFGRLVVTGRDGSFVTCLCDCGNEVKLHPPHLTRKKNNRISCGCASLERAGKKRPQIYKEGTAFRKVLYTYQYSAKHRGFDFNLTEEEFRRLTLSDCYYCGEKPGREEIAMSGEVYRYNGLDRVHNFRGYTTDNVVPCCWSCNELKGGDGQKLFLNKIAKIYRYRLGDSYAI